jgi:hypothetical protein
MTNTISHLPLKILVEYQQVLSIILGYGSYQQIFRNITVYASRG